MNAAHTPGKLVVRGGFSLYAEDGKTPVADACLGASIATHDEGNARRLAACWNSCDGIQTEMLEQIPGIAGSTVPYRVLRAEHATLLEFARAVRALESTLGHPEASVADEQKAEARYTAALTAVAPLLYPQTQPVAIPAEAAAIGAALDSESLEQGEPA